VAKEAIIILIPSVSQIFWDFSPVIVSTQSELMCVCVREFNVCLYKKELILVFVYVKNTVLHTPSHYTDTKHNTNSKYSFHTTFQTVAINIFMTGQQSNRFPMGSYNIWPLQIRLMRYYIPPAHTNTHFLFKCAKVRSLIFLLCSHTSLWRSYLHTFHTSQ
jgi:hypothetical protein